MNYLAHIALSGPEREHQIGGFLGDFVKGSLRGERPVAIEQGIALHRQIDRWGDSQPEVANFYRYFDPPWRRYAGIVCDIYFDHLLAKHWQKLRRDELDKFCCQFYTNLAEVFELLPEGAQRFAQTAPKNSWLQGYQYFHHLPVILHRVGQRFKKPVALEQLVNDLSYNHDAIEKDFFSLFPRLQAFSDQQRQLWRSQTTQHMTSAETM